jgi:6-phosphogluconate dehydrogenase
VLSGKCVKQVSLTVLKKKEYAECWARKGDESCLEQIVLYLDIDDIVRSLSRPKATMVPGAALSKQQKMLFGKLELMHIVIDGNENVYFEDYGSHVLMLAHD